MGAKRKGFGFFVCFTAKKFFKRIKFAVDGYNFRGKEIRSQTIKYEDQV